MKRIMGVVPWGRGLLPALVAGFLLIRWGEARGTAPGWLRHFGDDLLCLPLVLTVALILHRLVRNSPHLTLPVSHGFLALVFFALYFEALLPRTGSPAVADPVDILMYAVGLLVFQVGLNRGVAKPGRLSDIPQMKFS